MSIPAPSPQRHTCPLPYPYLFVDEIHGRHHDPDLDSYSPPGRSVAIDHPRYEDGRLARCPQCHTWWVFRRHETPPHATSYYVQCIATYRPAWHTVKWSDFGLRRRIRETEDAGGLEEFPPPPVIPAPHPLEHTPPRFF